MSTTINTRTVAHSLANLFSGSINPNLTLKETHQAISEIADLYAIDLKKVSEIQALDSLVTAKYKAQMQPYMDHPAEKVAYQIVATDENGTTLSSLKGEAFVNKVLTLDRFFTVNGASYVLDNNQVNIGTGGLTVVNARKRFIKKLRDLGYWTVSVYSQDDTQLASQEFAYSRKEKFDTLTGEFADPIDPQSVADLALSDARIQALIMSVVGDHDTEIKSILEENVTIITVLDDPVTPSFSVSPDDDNYIDESDFEDDEEDVLFSDYQALVLKVKTLPTFNSRRYSGPTINALLKKNRSDVARTKCLNAVESRLNEMNTILGDERFVIDRQRTGGSIIFNKQMQSKAYHDVTPDAVADEIIRQLVLKSTPASLSKQMILTIDVSLDGASRLGGKGFLAKLTVSVYQYTPSVILLK